MIAVVVIVIALAVTCLSFLLPKTFTGVWELTVNPEVEQATPDEIEESDRVYYIFEKPDRYGKGEWKVCYDGGEEYYEYKLLEQDGKMMVNLGSVDLEYEISGFRIFGNAKIKITYPEYTDEQTE